MDCRFLSGPFTVDPFWNFWNTGRKNQSSRSKIYEIWEQMIGSGGIPTNSKSKTPSADSNLGPRCEGSGKKRSCLHWDLASGLQMKLEIPRVEEEEGGWEEFSDFEPCLQTSFGTSVNDLPNFSTKMSGIQTSC
ncbi:hypothetical protein AVEN_267326-1 [Araneus ventricosus]|uniref:Uncharacterized protein n=1 Tax=Araneus ventricosus TaxID=182803 RepID=A0A4Y2DMQ2_ARAVE|nr:hypothetical protein AVEN_267326-1 [Araneus ventricosus]